MRGQTGTRLVPYLTILGLWCTVTPQATQGCEAQRGSMTRRLNKEPFHQYSHYFRRFNSSDDRACSASTTGQTLSFCSTCFQSRRAIFPGLALHSTNPHHGSTYRGYHCRPCLAADTQAFIFFSEGGLPEALTDG